MNWTDLATIAGVVAIAQFSIAILMFIRNRVREREEDKSSTFEIIVKRADGTIRSCVVPSQAKDAGAFLSKIGPIGDHDQVGMFRIPAADSKRQHTFHGV
jgi:hypothetical protein